MGQPGSADQVALEDNGAATALRQEGERRVVAQETSGSDGIAADHNRFRVLVTVRFEQG
jgi:hypothetical protein